jgi:hypothetical protein
VVAATQRSGDGLIGRPCHARLPSTPLFPLRARADRLVLAALDLIRGLPAPPVHWCIYGALANSLDVCLLTVL